MLLVPVVYVKFYKKKSIRKELGFEKFEVKKFLKNSLLVFATLLVYSMLLSILFFITKTNDFGTVEETAKGIAIASPIIIIYLLGVKVFCEELFFRAFLVPKIGIIGASVAFGIAHIGYGSIGQVIGAIILGIILSIAYNQNRSIYSNYTAHALYNIITILMVA